MIHRIALARRQAEGERRLHLALVQQFDARAEDLGEEGAAVDAEPQDRGGVRGNHEELVAHLGQGEVDPIEDHQDRYAAEEADIDPGEAAQRAKREIRSSAITIPIAQARQNATSISSSVPSEAMLISTIQSPRWWR